MCRQLLKFEFMFLLGLLTPILNVYAQEGLPWISVLDNHFVDEKSETQVFQGLNTSDPDKLERQGHWNEEYFDAIAEWNANLVRFPVHPRAWRERGEKEYIELLDQGIAWAAARNMYVIIDWHSIGNLKDEIFQHNMYVTDLEETIDFWKTMARHYGKNSNVAFFELFNEPTTNEGKYGETTWDEWKITMERLIDTIRIHGAQNIPLIAGFNWAYDLVPVETNPIVAEQVAYVCHPYPQKRPKPWKDQWEKDWAFVSETYPMILTEIGFCSADAEGAHVPVISDESYVEEITDFALEKGISYIIWVFDPQWTPMLIKDWSYEPTEAGAVWKHKLSTH